MKLTMPAPTTADATLGHDLKNRRTADLRARLPASFLAGLFPARKARLTQRQLAEFEADWRGWDQLGEATAPFSRIASAAKQGGIHVKQYVDENDPKNSIRKYQVHLLFDIREMPLAPFLNGSFTLRA